MKNNKTLRTKYSSKFENIYKCAKETEAKIKYQKFNFQPKYIYEYDKQKDNLVVYFSNLEKHFNLDEKVFCYSDLNKIIKFKKLKKYLDKNNHKKTKRYCKNSTMVSYIYEFKIMNKILFCKNNILYDKVFENEIGENNVIIYELDVYMYPNNDYTNDGENIIERIQSFSPDWFYYNHLKKHTYSYGNYFIKNYKTKNRNNNQQSINDYFNNFDDIDLESIEKN